MGTLRRPRQLDANGIDKTATDDTAALARSERDAKAEVERRTATLQQLPLTPAMTAALTREAKVRWRTPVLIVSVMGGVGLAPILGVVMGGPVSALLLFPLFVILGIGIAFAMVLFKRRRIRADVATGQFLRATGMSSVEYVRRTGDFLIVGQQSYYLGDAEVRNHLRAQAWRAIDLSLRAGVVFEARDVAGRVIYRLPGYEPDGTP